MLLAFAGWTLLLLMVTVGVYRWSRILTGRAAIREFRADHVEGEGWYRRAMRAHANCVENLPVLAAIVIALQASGTRGALASGLTVMIVLARIVQSLVHVLFVQDNRAVSVRFAFYFVQVIGFVWLIALIVARVLSAAG